MVGMEIDIIERRLAENQLAEQSQRLMDLSTPMIPINDRVVVLPLVGAIDAKRADQMLSTLLCGPAQNRAQVATLDITGVSTIDSHVAAVLVNAARAVQLLGAEVVLTGMRPEVATTLVGLNIDLGNIVTRANLRSGVAYATSQEQRGPVLIVARPGSRRSVPN
ncbi:anti-anti-sigma factor [Nannocystis exedens]|uniref:Anti-anti-sigma factor n=2 Tax=Nannocystis exedens TaxID=54 RepID=A0A1I2IWP0_9BACT|nr:RsbT co-antagonist protein RsbRA [Nannocystis exedens]SFF46609.1 anti-anti-sigma factor [Nannocystis exedens]